jgi:hypothetical protein
MRLRDYRLQHLDMTWKSMAGAVSIRPRLERSRTTSLRKAGTGQ